MRSHAVRSFRRSSRPCVLSASGGAAPRPWPITMYACAVIAAFGAFGYSDRAGAPIGSGMSVDNLTTAISISFGILAATTGVIISYLFVVNHDPANTAPALTPAAPEPIPPANNPALLPPAGH